MIGGDKPTGDSLVLQFQTRVQPLSFKEQAAGVQGQQGRVLLAGQVQLRRFSGQTAQLVGDSAAGLNLTPHVISVEEQQLRW